MFAGFDDDVVGEARERAREAAGGLGGVRRDLERAGELLHAFDVVAVGVRDQDRRDVAEVEVEVAQAGAGFPRRKTGVDHDDDAAALDHEAVALAARTKNADPHGAGIAGLIGRCWSSLSDRGAVSSCF